MTSTWKWSVCFFLSVYLFICLFVYPFVCLFVCLSFCLFVCLFICLFVCSIAYSLKFFCFLRVGMFDERVGSDGSGCFDRTTR